MGEYISNAICAIVKNFFSTLFIFLITQFSVSKTYLSSFLSQKDQVSVPLVLRTIPN